MNNYQSLMNKAIKSLRVSKGLSQEKFSELCNLSSDNIRNIEHNRHCLRPSSIDKICSAFNITPLELLSYGADTTDNKVIIADLLEGLTDGQIDLVKNFIKLIKGYKP